MDQNRQNIFQYKETDFKTNTNTTHYEIKNAYTLIDNMNMKMIWIIIICILEYEYEYDTKYSNMHIIV